MGLIKRNSLPSTHRCKPPGSIIKSSFRLDEYPRWQCDICQNIFTAQRWGTGVIEHQVGNDWWYYVNFRG